MLVSRHQLLKEWLFYLQTRIWNTIPDKTKKNSCCSFPVYHSMLPACFQYIIVSKFATMEAIRHVPHYGELLDWLLDSYATYILFNLETHHPIFTTYPYKKPLNPYISCNHSCPIFMLMYIDCKILQPHNHPIFTTTSASIHCLDVTSAIIHLPHYLP